MPAFEGSQWPPTGRFAIVASKFNHEVVEKLVAGAQGTLRSKGIPDDAITLVWVPGAFELPLVAQRLAASNRYAAVICLGAVIRGDTDHYDYVCKAAADGILQAGLTTGVPVLFGVLTCDTDEQAHDRAGGKAGNKGADVALAAIEMANLLKTLA
ncbi:MAG: 6,7-dimethyl-8-ribityllumazine synthase [Planctomycetes bacterium]|nr:6,7-dimethyl-8-ribityllumazine synthase [Planctomycetota bacterium]